MENVLIYGSIFNMTDKLTDEQVGKLFKAISKWRDGTEPQFEDPMLVGIWMGISPNLEKLKVNFDAKVAANRENGKKGGRPKKVVETPKEEINNPTEAPAETPETVKEESVPSVPEKELSPFEAEFGDSPTINDEPVYTFDPMDVIKPAYNGKSEKVLEYVESVKMNHLNLRIKEDFITQWEYLDKVKFRSTIGEYWLSNIMYDLD